MMDDLPELFRPISTVIGLKRRVTSSSKSLKLEMRSSFNMTSLRRGNYPQALHPSIIHYLDRYAFMFA